MVLLLAYIHFLFLFPTIQRDQDQQHPNLSIMTNIHLHLHLHTLKMNRYTYYVQFQVLKCATCLNSVFAYWLPIDLLRVLEVVRILVARRDERLSFATAARLAMLNVLVLVVVLFLFVLGLLFLLATADQAADEHQRQ